MRRADRPRSEYVRAAAAAAVSLAGWSAGWGQSPPAGLGPNAAAPRENCGSGAVGCWPACGCGAGCGCIAMVRQNSIGTPVGPGGGGFASSNVVLLSRISIPEFGAQYTSASDSASYVSPSGREYAIIGLNSAVAFVDITNPRQPQILGTAPKPNSVWADTVIYGQYAYVVSDQQGVGITIVNLASIDQGLISVVGTVSPQGLRTVHSAFVNGSTLYLAGSNAPTNGLIALSLANPTNPTIVGTYAGAYVHDMQVVNYTSGPYAGKEIAFCYMGTRGLDIVDVTNKAAMTRLSRTTYANLGYCHQGWLDFSTNLIYVNDELDETNIPTATPALRRVFNVSNLAAPALVGTFPDGLNVIDHNNQIRNGYLFAADYRAGMRIFDLRANPTNPPTVGWFDTYNGPDAREFDGAWNSDPFYPSGVVIVSDIEGGLFVLDPTFAVTGGAPLLFEIPGGAPEFVAPPGGSFTVRVSGRNGYTPGAEAPTLFWRVGTAGPFAASPMTPAAVAGEFTASIGRTACLSTIQYYLSAKDNLGRTMNQPLNAPFDVLTATSAWGRRPAGGAPTCVIPGDTNGDDVVNFVDLNIVLSQFGSSGGGLAGDVNGDGVVDFSDLNALLSNYGRTN